MDKLEIQITCAFWDETGFCTTLWELENDELCIVVNKCEEKITPNKSFTFSGQGVEKNASNRIFVDIHQISI